MLDIYGNDTFSLCCEGAVRGGQPIVWQPMHSTEKGRGQGRARNACSGTAKEIPNGGIGYADKWESVRVSDFPVQGGC